MFLSSLASSSFLIDLCDKTGTLSRHCRCHWSPLPSMLLTLINVGMRWYSSHLPCGGNWDHWCAKAGLRFLVLCAQPWYAAVWGVGTELKVISFSEGGDGMLQSQEFFSIRPSNKWRKTVARVLLLLLCPDQHNPHLLWIRHSYGWAEEDSNIFSLRWDTP